MEKTKKNKKSKKAARLRRRIGMFVVAGLSLVLTVSMAVGSTLAWFAGSTWASKDLYLGGPVYLEMSGDPEFNGGAKAGAGNLDITVSGRSSGTHSTGTSNDGNVMLPGQRVNIASYARVFSTGTTDSVADDLIVNGSSGADTQNSGNSTGTASFQNNKGRVTTSTTSVLRARYSLNIEFDPSTGYNNFTSEAYQDNYPVQHQTSWDYELPTFSTYTTVEGKSQYVKTFTEVTYASTDDYTSAKASTEFKTIQIPCVAKVDSQTAAQALVAKDATYEGYPICEGADHKWYVFAQGVDGETIPYYMAANIGRRDTVTSTNYTDDVVSTFSYTAGTGVKVTTDATAKLTGLNGNTKLTSMYKWKYVSKAEYLSYGKYEDNHAGNIKYWQPGKANMLGSIGISDATGDTLKANSYAVFILLDASGKEVTGYTATDSDTVTYAESDAFYKARCNAYLTSYDEVYVNEYGNLVKRNIGTSLAALESSLNTQFTSLINRSSATIQSTDEAAGGLSMNAQWMYIDPLAGNDTNSGEISTQVGGWFYLVAINDTADDTKYYNWTSGEVKAKTSGDPATTQYYYVEIDNPAAGGDGEPAKLELKIYNKYYGAASDKNTYNLNMVATDADNDIAIKYKDINGDGALDEGEYYTILQKSSTVTAKPDGSSTVTNNYFTRLSNQLYEVIPNAGSDDSVSYVNGNDNIVKVYSKSIPFVNGAFTIPEDEITNIFSNAKISVQVSFQAVQAFLPYTQKIDGITDGNADTRLGKEKALTIQNAIYVFNEAFDYSEGGNDFDDSIL